MVQRPEEPITPELKLRTMLPLQKFITQKLKLPNVLLVVTVVTLAVLEIGTFTLHWKWTGFDGNSLWDWLNLLLTPFGLIVVTAWFNRHPIQIAAQPGEQQHLTDPDTASDNKQEAVLRLNLERISVLLLKENLRKSELGSEQRNIARAWILMALCSLDADRKGSLLQFLQDLNLIIEGLGHSIIDLEGANLSEANLAGAMLSGAKLSGVDLSGADLSDTKLIQVNLSRANLSRANLSRANLNGANLSWAKVTKEQLMQAKSFEGATMPDGSCITSTWTRKSLGGTIGPEEARRTEGCEAQNRQYSNSMRPNEKNWKRLSASIAPLSRSRSEDG